MQAQINKYFLEVFTMNEVVKFLTENPVQFLATVDKNGLPQTGDYSQMR